MGGCSFQDERTWSVSNRHKHREGIAVKYFAGLDVLLEETSIRVVEETGRALRELRATSEPEALVAASWETDSKLERAGLEAGTLTAWLQERLTQARLFACLVK
jgi:transposase